MKLLTKSIESKLRDNFMWQRDELNPFHGTQDFAPVVKLFNPSGAATWLLTELDDDGVMFGLCDTGYGSPELGYVSLKELSDFRGRFGLGIERDRSFRAVKTIAAYADDARSAGRIIA